MKVVDKNIVSPIIGSILIIPICLIGKIIFKQNIILVIVSCISASSLVYLCVLIKLGNTYFKEISQNIIKKTKDSLMIERNRS